MGEPCGSLEIFNLGKRNRNPTRTWPGNPPSGERLFLFKSNLCTVHCLTLDQLGRADGAQPGAGVLVICLPPALLGTGAVACPSTRRQKDQGTQGLRCVLGLGLEAQDTTQELFASSVCDLTHSCLCGQSLPPDETPGHGQRPN